MKSFWKRSGSLLLAVMLVMSLLCVGASAAAPADYTAEITWADPVVGEVTGKLTLDPENETWELYYETPFGPYTLGGWYLADGTMGLTNDGGLGGFLDFAPIEAAAAPAIVELVGASAAPDTMSAQITWADPVVGEVTGTLTLDPATETWELYYETAFGPYTLGGWYLADGTMGLTNDGGLGGFLDFSPIEAVAAPAIVELVGSVSGSKTYSDEITWADPVVGSVTGTLTITPATETWELYYETPFGPYTLGGWYLTADGTMGLTNDGGLGGFLDFAPIEAAAVPSIKKMIEDNGLTGGSGAADCKHKWKDGVCAACGTACPHEEWNGGKCKACAYVCDHVGTHDASTLICTVCGSKGYHTFKDYTCGCGVTTIFEMDGIPMTYLAECDQKGTVETVTYTTKVYATGETAETAALVYLPYGYDPAKSYDIMYLMHGGGGNYDYWFNGAEMNGLTTVILDNAIKSGLCDPVIVVTPTFNTNGVTDFGKEMVEALIPAVEGKYSTYAKGDVSDASLKATRAHRAYAGLSMGSMVSWSSILDYCTDYIGYVGSWSAGPDAAVDSALKMTGEIAANLKADLAASGSKMYFWFNGNGVDDIAHDPHLYAYPEMLELCPEIFTDGVNACWVDYLEGQHSAYWWQLDLLNSLKVFFKLDEAGEAPELEALAAAGKIHAVGAGEPPVVNPPQTGENYVVPVCAAAAVMALLGLALVLGKKRVIE